MVAVVFELWPKPGNGGTYLKLGQSMLSLVDGFERFISIERFESVVEPGEFLTISNWRNEEAVAAWRNAAEHRRIQDGSLRTVFDNYRLRVAKVMCDYSMNKREQTPPDSVAVHG